MDGFVVYFFSDCGYICFCYFFSIGFGWFVYSRLFFCLFGFGWGGFVVFGGGFEDVVFVLIDFEKVVIIVEENFSVFGGYFVVDFSLENVGFGEDFGGFFIVFVCIEGGIFCIKIGKSDFFGFDVFFGFGFWLGGGFGDGYWSVVCDGREFGGLF